MIAFSIYAGTALVFSLAAVLALGAAMQVEGRFRGFMVPSLFLIIVAYLGISTVLSGRNVSMSWIDAGAIAPASTLLAVKVVKGLAIVTALTVCVARILAAAFSRENAGSGGGSLFLAFGLFFLTNTVLTSALGTQPDFVYYLYYAPFFFAAVFASRTQDPEIAVRFAKCGLLIFLAGSCVVSIVAPDLTIQRMYAGWLPGITIRFWGLAPHANHMAPAALLYLLVAIHQPFERRWLHYLGIVIAAAVLVLTQSKTTWVAAAITVPLLLVLRSRSSLTSDGRGAKAPYKIGLAATCLLALGVFGVAALLVLPELGVSVDRMLAPRARNEIATLTGRDIIWAVALDEWRRNPLFGYGASMWNDAYRIQIGLEEATSAHNQFLQSLGSAGLVGLTGLLVYVGALMLHAINARRATRGLSVAVFTTILVRCFTETPLEVDAFLTCDFIVHLLLFHLAFGRRDRVVSLVRPATSFTLSARGS